MGSMKHRTTGAVVTLYPRQLVGRSAAAELRLADGLCSSRHCEITWKGGAWTIRDLNSRNGTWLDGRRLGPADRAQVEPGALVAFGNPADPWEIVEVGEPTAVLLGPSGEVVIAEDDLLVAPGEGRRWTARRDDEGGWLVEDPHGACESVDGERVLEIDGRPWRLICPTAADETARLQITYAIDRLALRLRTGRAPRDVLVEAVIDGVAVPVETRAHHALLVVLARARVRDLDAPPDDQGWTAREELQQALKVDDNELNQQIYRLRQQFSRMGLQGAARLVERRSTDGMVRLGISDLDLAPLGK